MKILFLHGWHSVPGGVKPTYLKDNGHTSYSAHFVVAFSEKCQKNASILLFTTMLAGVLRIT